MGIFLKIRGRFFSHLRVIREPSLDPLDVWAAARKAEGWTYGPVRDDEKMQHPDLIPYSALSEAEKEYDRIMSMNTIKLVKKLGFEIVKK